MNDFDDFDRTGAAIGEAVKVAMVPSNPFLAWLWFGLFMMSWLLTSRKYEELIETAIIATDLEAIREMEKELEP
jgi:hypothetical protein